jgi:hypothetical protein
MCWPAAMRATARYRVSLTECAGSGNTRIVPSWKALSISSSVTPCLRHFSRFPSSQIDDDLSIHFISRQDLLIAKLEAGRAQDLIDVDALRESSQSPEIDHQESASSPAQSSQNEPEQIRKEGREDWLKQRQQKSSAETVEELRAKGREDWRKLRQQQTRENPRDPPDRSAEKDQGAKPDDLPGRLDKGLDDDL